MRLAGSIAIALAATMLAASLSASDVAGQAQSGARKERSSQSFTWNSPIAIRVLSVAVAQAEQIEACGSGVPIEIAWETGPWGDRVLLELKATLTVTDDMGATVELTKGLGVKDKKDTLVLTLAEGRMPKRYEVMLIGQCRFTGEDGKVRIEPTTAQLAGTF